MTLKSTIAGALLGLGLISTPVLAQSSPIELKGDVMVEKTVIQDDGTEKTELVAPDVIVPGDRLVFGTDFANAGSEVVTSFVVTNPVPDAVRLAPDADEELIVSIDGGKNYAKLADLSVTEEDGSTRPAEHADVTHVRWILPSVQPGESGRREYPAIIR